MARPMGADLARKGTLRTWWLSSELRRHREAAGITIAEVVRRTGISRAAVQRSESGESTPHARNLRDLLTLYGVRGAERSLLEDLASQPDANGWWQAYRDLPEDYSIYIGFEAQAAEVRNFELANVPGLLQTPAYAEAVIRDSVPGISDTEVAKRVKVRVQRQAVFTSAEPLVFHAVIDESVLYRKVGGTAVVREQLRALAHVPPTATLQVVPLDVGAHPGLGGSFSILRFRHERAPLAVSVETGAGQLLVEADTDVGRYTQWWEGLLAKALSPENSARLIADAARKSK